MDLSVHEFKPLARRHGISEARMLEAIADCRVPLFITNLITGDDDLVLLLGRDRSGVPLEIMGREITDGTVVVFHAMRRRPGYADLHRQLEGRR